MSAGTLLVNNTTGSGTGSGAVTVNNGGTLGGINGTINAGANTITIGSGATGTNAATITGGTNGSVGALTLTASSMIFSGSSGNLATYLVDLSGVTADKLTLTGDLNLGGTFDQIKFTSLTTPTAASYQLLTYNGMLTGTFETVTGLPSGYALQYNPGEIDLVAVPEPATCLAGLLALGTLGWNQRRRLRGWLPRESAGKL